MTLSAARCALAIPYGNHKPEVQVGDKVRFWVYSDVFPDPIEGRLLALTADELVVLEGEDPDTVYTIHRNDALRIARPPREDRWRPAKLPPL